MTGLSSSPPAPAASEVTKATMRDVDFPVYREWRVLPISTLTSIATVIGSGILALPVTLYQTSVSLFLVLFTFSLFAQIAVVYAVVELLQRAQEAALEERSASNTSLDGASSSSYDSITQRPTHEVSLFDIAQRYLHSAPVRYLFYITTLLGFISMIVSYALAGPQAVWQLMSPGLSSNTHPPMILFFSYWLLGTCAVIFFVDFLLGVFGSFTVLKGGLFVGVVIIVAALPTSSRVASISTLLSDFSGWRTAAGPLLMSCVALGGLSNTMPVTFKLLPSSPSRAQVRRYRYAIILAVIICYLLNIGWVLAVLQVVPRTAGGGKPSLSYAYEKGQISTVPLIDSLYVGKAVTGSLLKLIEIIVELFILVSTGVSFFVTAAGMKSFVDGGVNHLKSDWEQSGWIQSGWTQYLPTISGYTLTFGTVAVLVLANPHGFISVLMLLGSFTLNLQAGTLLFVMLYNCRKAVAAALSAETDAEVGVGQTRKRGIPLEMPSSLARGAIGFGLTFFTCGCLLASIGPLVGIKLGHE